MKRFLPLLAAMLFVCPARTAEIPTQVAKMGDVRKVTKPMEEAVTKTAETAVKEAKEVAKEAHTLGGKILQSIVNVMIAASPGKTRVYLPAPSSDPNSGITVGVLPVFLFVDKKEQIQHILAPSITYNKIFNMTSTMRYYWYPRGSAQLFTLASYALETNRRLAFRYEDPAFYADWLYFKFDFNYSHDGSFRFFGIGPKSREEDQHNYTQRDEHLQVHAGINFLEHFRLTFSNRYRIGDAVNGPISSLKQITAFNPRPPGVDGKTKTFAQRLTLSLDTRDNAMAPVRGHYFNLFAEAAGHAGGDSKYERLGADLRGFYPLDRARYVTGWRFLMEGENGENVPFYEQSLLGGKDSLRGFGEARWVDRNKMSVSVEERIRLYTLQAFNVNIDFEMAPFYEVGTVYSRVGRTNWDDLHHVGGVGFRSAARPNVVGVIELGFSEEGGALFVGIDYPF